MRNLLLFSVVALGLTCPAATKYASADGRFTYELTNGAATITKYTPVDGETSVSIPSSLGGCPVVALGEKSFMNTLRVPSKDDGIRFSLVIPDTVRVIEKYAFDGCTRMERVSIPGSVETIGDYAFQDCLRLASVSLGEGVKQIGRSAFSNSVEASIVDLHGTLRLVFPSTLKELGNTAFAGNQNVGEVVFRAPLETTGASAFVSCQYLKRVMLAEGQTEIVEKMFRYCSALEEINIPSTVKAIGQYAFDGCKTLASVSIPGSVETIGDYAFQDCLRLASVSFGEGVKQIGRSAFSNSGEASIVDLHGTLRLVFPSTLKDLGNTAFAGNQNVGEVVFRAPLETTGTSAFASCKYLREVVLAEGQTEIAEKMFRYCYALEQINIPSTVTGIGQYAFERCRSLGAVEIPFAVASIGTSAFKGCRGLHEVTVPEGAEIAGWPFEKGTVVHVSGTVVPTGCKPSGTVSVPAGDIVWREAVTTAGGVVVEDVAFETEATLTMAQKAYCLGSVRAGETVVRVVGDAATISACDALGIAPTRTVVAAKSRAAAGDSVTLTFAEPKVEVVACDFAGRTLTVRVVPGEGTSRASAFLPSRFVAEGGPSLGELSLWRAPATSAAGTEAELSAEEKAYANSGLVTFALPDAGGARSAFWRATVR